MIKHYFTSHRADGECDICPLPESDAAHTPTNGAVLSDEEIALERSQLTQDEQKILATLPTLTNDDEGYQDDGGRTRIPAGEVSSHNTVTIQAGRNSNRVFNAIVRFEDVDDRCELERTYTHSGEMGFDIFEWVSAGKLPK